MTRVLASVFVLALLVGAVACAYLKGVENGSDFVLCQIARVLDEGKLQTRIQPCEAADSALGLRLLESLALPGNAVPQPVVIS